MAIANRKNLEYFADAKHSTAKDTLHWHVHGDLL